MCTPKDLQELILNTRNPVVLRGFRNQLNWDCFGSDLKEWCSLLDKQANQPSTFERMTKRCGHSPQWERKRCKVELTANQFLKDHQKETDFWTGLHYVQLAQLPHDFAKKVDFGRFNFSGQLLQTALWMGSKGANTPCHYDCYGCNIVVQIYGKKSWLLFHPSAPLTTTRVPYEESSVYCYENFYAPHPEEISNLTEKLHQFAYHCVLEADDVLIVPQHWWHFVEAEDTSLTVNMWVPLESDNLDQLDESIVKYIIENSIRNERDDFVENNLDRYFLNPNQLCEVNSDPVNIRIVDECRLNFNKKNQQRFPYESATVGEVESLKLEIQKHTTLENVQPLKQTQFIRMLQINSERFAEDESTENVKVDLKLLNTKEQLINSMCSPVVIATIREELCKRLDSSKMMNTVL